MTITLPERLAVIAEDLLKGRFIDSGRWDLHNGHDYHDRTSESTPTSSSQRHRRTSSSPHDGEMESRKKGNSYTIKILRCPGAMNSYKYDCGTTLKPLIYVN